MRQLRLWLAEWLLSAAMRVVPKDSVEAVFLASALREYLTTMDGLKGVFDKFKQ